MNTITPFIDRQYYGENYKPELNARISGNYNKVAEHSANFDSFALRSSELVNRLTHNEIYNLGGLSYCSPKAQEWLKKASASLVEYWYLNDYKLGDIQLAFSMGGISLNRVKNNETLRKFIPETTLAYVQSSGLGKQSVAFLNTGNIGKKVEGLNSNDFYTKDMAKAIFQPAGQYDANFHKSIDLKPEQAGTMDERYYAIAKQENISGDGDISFTLLGGNQKGNAQVKYFVSLVFLNGLIDASTSGVSTINPNADDQLAPLEFLAVQDGTTITLYIKSYDDALDVLITDITPDTSAIFDLFGSSITAPTNAIILNLLSYVTSSTNIDQLEDRVSQNETDIVTLQNEQADLPTIRQEIATNAGNISQNTTDIQNVKSTADTAKAESTQNAVDIATNKTNIDKKLDTDYSVSENSKIPQVVNGKLVLVEPTSLQPDLSLVEGIGVDDNTLTTTNKRFNTAINELDRKKVEYLNDGSNFKLNGDNDKDYDVRMMDVNSEGIVALNETIDNILTSSTNKEIPVATPIPFVVSGDTLTADISTLDFSMVGVSFDVFVKVEDTDTGSSEIIRESYNNGAVTDIKFFTDDNATAELTSQSLVIDNVTQSERANKVIVSIEYRQPGASVDVSTKANITLDNVTDTTFKAKGVASGLATTDDVAVVDAKVTTNTTAIAANKVVADKAAADVNKLEGDVALKANLNFDNVSAIQIFDGQVLSFSKQKTTGAFADRTLFSELVIPKGYAILGGTGGISTKGSIPETTATQAGHKHINGVGSDVDEANPPYGFSTKTAKKSGGSWDGGTMPYTDTQTPKITISQSVTHNATGEVLGAGIEIVAYVYTALKDITFAEMGK